MSPRPYRLGRRQQAADATRERIVAAARDVLMGDEGVAGFTVDVVAQRAGVARMTVYHQFGSKRGLLEAVLDWWFAEAGGMALMPEVFRRPDPIDALAAFVTTLAHIYDSARPVFRRLHGLAAIDPELGEALTMRQERRRDGVRTLVGRLGKRAGGLPADELIDVLFTLTSFASFDQLAGPGQSLREVAPTIQRAALALAEALPPDR
jgi:AcrR family transcriptional regulator